MARRVVPSSCSAQLSICFASTSFTRSPAIFSGSSIAAACRPRVTRSALSSLIEHVLEVHFRERYDLRPVPLLVLPNNPQAIIPCRMCTIALPAPVAELGHQYNCGNAQRASQMRTGGIDCHQHIEIGNQPRGIAPRLSKRREIPDKAIIAKLGNLAPCCPDL